MASRGRLSTPTLAAELVRKYANAGVLFFLDIVPIPPRLIVQKGRRVARKRESLRQIGTAVARQLSGELRTKIRPERE